jgi:hypothetical protein
MEVGTHAMPAALETAALETIVASYCRANKINQIVGSFAGA